MNDPSPIALPENPDTVRSRKRIVGYDFARALAIFGMVIVNYKIVMGAEQAGPHWLLDVFGLLDGRAAATFVVLAGAGTAIVVITGSIALTERFATVRWIQLLVSTGRLALTLYVAHVVIGMGTLETLGMLENQNPPFAIGSALLFCVLSVGFAHLWKQRFQQGPLEGVMRRLTG